VKSSPWPHSIIAEKSNLVRKKKPHVKKSRETSIKGTGPVAQIRIATTSLNQ